MLVVRKPTVCESAAYPSKPHYTSLQICFAYLSWSIETRYEHWF